MEAHAIERRPQFGAAAVWVSVAVVLVVAAGVWALFALRVATAKPVPHVDVPQPNAVVWRGRVYQSRAKLDAYLRAHDKSYVVWARQHPGAAALLARLAAAKHSRR